MAIIKSIILGLTGTALRISSSFLGNKRLKTCYVPYHKERHLQGPCWKGYGNNLKYPGDSSYNIVSKCENFETLEWPH